MVRLLFTIFSLLISPIIVHAEDWSAEIVDFGVYELDRGDTTENSSVAGGLITVYDKRLISQTSEVDGKVGVSFGFRYKLKGPLERVEVTIKVKHPKAIKDPNKEKPIEVSQWHDTVFRDELNWDTGWTFEHPWEIVSGEWKIELWHQDKLLQGKTFNIRP